MIDCQNTYRQGIMRLEGVEAALAEAARLLARADRARVQGSLPGGGSQDRHPEFDQRFNENERRTRHAH